MKIDTYFKRFILIFFLGKLLLIGFSFFLGSFDVYAFHQVRDIIFIIVPTFATSLILFLNFLKKNRVNTIDSSVADKRKRVSKTEVVIVFFTLGFYLFFIFFQLLSADASVEAFNGLKLRIAFAETLCGGLIGWVLLELNNYMK